jgi:hypothetical protein
MQKIILTLTSSNGQVSQKVLNQNPVQVNGQPVKFKVPAGHTLSVQVMAQPGKEAALSTKAWSPLKTKRVGDHLMIEDEEGQSLLEVTDHYVTPNVQFTQASWVPYEAQLASADGHDSLASKTLSGDANDNDKGADKDRAGTSEGAPLVVSLFTLGSVAPVLGAVTVGALAAGSGGSSEQAPSTITPVTMVSGQVMAGPVVSGHNLSVQIFAADGKTLLANATVDAGTGRFAADVGDYKGAIIAVLLDAGSENDYRDEATGQAKDLNATLMAVGVAVTGQPLVLNITALTTLAAQKAGVQADGSVNATTPITTTAVDSSNAAVSKAFGLTDILRGSIVATLTSDGTLNPDANLYGKVLAALSGLDSAKGGDTQAAINSLVDQLSTETGHLSDAGVAILLAGAAKAGVSVSQVAQALGSNGNPNVLGLELTSGGEALFKMAVAGKALADVDSVAELRALSQSVQAVMGGTASKEQLALLGADVTSVTADNLKAIQNATAANDPTSVADLQTVLGHAVAAFDAALGALKTAATGNTASATTPDRTVWAALGITDVDNTNLAAINSLLNTTGISGTSHSSAGALQAMISAYMEVTAGADNTGDKDTTLDAAQISALGLSGVIDSAAKRRLFDDVLDQASITEVDLGGKIEALAAAVQAVMAGTASKEQLALLGANVTNVTTENLKAIQTAIGAGSPTSLVDLQTLIGSGSAISPFDAAITKIANYADDNGAANPVPQASDYSALAITGIGGSGQPTVAMVNEALATGEVIRAEADSAADVQAIVNAYQVILDNANTASSTDASANDYLAIGVTGVDTAEEVALLGSVIDNKAAADVDTIAKLQALADAVQAVAGYGTGTPPTDAQINALLGTSTVTADNLAAVLAAIKAGNADGTAINGIGGAGNLSEVVGNAITAFNTALGTLTTAATSNNATATTPAITAWDNAGIVGVTPANLAEINSLLNTAGISGTSHSTAAQMQALVNAYLEVAAGADNDNDNDTALDTAQITALGLSSVIDTADERSLFDDVLDQASASEVDTGAKIVALANVVNKVMLQASGTPQTISEAEFELLGLDSTVLTPARAAELLEAMNNIGASSVDTLAKITALIDTTAPTLHASTIPMTATSTITGTPGTSEGETITLTLTFAENVNGLTSGTNSTVFTVGGNGVLATWAGTDGTATRTLTYTVSAGQNGQAAIVESALKTALTSGITDAAGNAFNYTANGGVITDIDSPALPVIDTTKPTGVINLVASLTASDTSLSYASSTGSFYRKVSSVDTFANASWDAANTWLMGQAGHLVQVNSAQENTSVRFIYKDTPASTTGTPGWLGLSDASSEGNWRPVYSDATTGAFIDDLNNVWTGGASSSGGLASRGNYANWLAGQPDNSGGSQNFASMDKDGKWIDSTGSEALQYMIEWEASAILNRSTYTEAKILKINSSEAGTAYLVNANHTPTQVGDILALTDDAWNSTILATGGLTILSSETFDTDTTASTSTLIGNKSGWTMTANGAGSALYTNLAGTEMDGFLGRISDNTGNEVLYQTYNFGASYANKSVIIDFDMYEIDDWNSDLFKVFINGTANMVQRYTNASSSFSDGGLDMGNLWNAGNGGHSDNSFTEFKHRYAVTGTTDATGSLKLGFGTNLDEALSNESFGIDNVVISQQATGTSSDLSLAGLANGTYKLYTADAAGNLSAAADETIRVDSTAQVTRVSLAATGAVNSLLNANDVVTVSVSFSDAVTVTGAPQVALVIGSTTVQASFAGGSGTNVLTFTYAIQSGQTDIDGLSVLANGLALNGGTIQVGSTAANLGHGALSNNASFKVDTTAPTTGSLSFVDTGASTGGNASDGITNNGIVTVNGLESNATWEYTTNSGASWTTGTGNTFTLTASSTPTGTTYAANAIQVRQTDAAGNVQTSNMATNAQIIRVDAQGPSAVDLNGAVAGTQATASHMLNLPDANIGKALTPNMAITSDTDIAQIRVTMTGVVANAADKFVLGSSTIHMNTTAQSGSNVSVGTPAVQVDWTYTSARVLTVQKSGGGTFTAAEVNAIETSWVFYSGGVTAGQGARIFTIAHLDEAGNTSTAAAQTVTVDTIVPTLHATTTPTISTTTVAATAGDSVGETITLTLTFAENVNGLTSGTNSTVFTVGGNGVLATWAGTDGTATRTLTYTVTAGQNGQAAIVESALKTALTSGITDAAGNAFNYTANGGVITDIDSPALPVIDTTAPTVDSVVISATGASGSLLNAGDVVTVTATYSDEVNGQPTTAPTLTIGSETGIALTAGTTTGNTRTWTYTISSAGTTDTGSIAVVGNLVAGVTDAAGYAATGSTPAATGSFTADTTAPTNVNASTQALSLNKASSQYAQMSNSAGSVSSDITMQAWIYMNGAQTDWTRIMELGNPDTDGGQLKNSISLAINNGKLNFHAIDSSGTLSHAVQTTDDLATNAWVHVAATVNASNVVTLYVNGVSVNQQIVTPSSGTIQNVTRSSNLIGQSNQLTNPANFNGMIADARIYDDARSAVEIQSDMQGMVDTSDAALKAQYAFNGNTNNGISGDTAATLVNGPTYGTASVSLSADTGVNAGDLLTNTAAQTISGVLNANLDSDESVQVSTDGGVTWATATANVGQKTWSASNQTLLTGANQKVMVKVVDTAGNEGLVKDYSYTLDTNAPTAKIDAVASILGATSGLQYSYSTGSFYKLTTSPTSWLTASDVAAKDKLMSQYGHIVQVNSAAENALILTSGYYSANGWLGFSDSYTGEGNWQPINGDKVGGGRLNDGTNFWIGGVGGSAARGDYVNWDSAQPSNISTLEDFAGIDYASGKWGAFDSAATRQYLTEWEGSAVLNQQTYTTAQSITVKGSEAGSAHLVSAIYSPTQLADLLALSDNAWNSVALASSAITVLSRETFDTDNTLSTATSTGIGSKSGWTLSANGAGSVLYTNIANTEMDGFLGRVADSTGTEVLKQTYDFGASYAGQTVTIDFDMYEIDTWDSELFKVFVNGTANSVQRYTNAGAAYSNGGVNLGDISNASNGGHTDAIQTEEKHHYTLTAQLDGNGRLTLGFGTNLDGGLLDESFGIDNVVISQQSAGTALSLAGLADGTYKLYTADEAGNLSAAADETIRIGATATVTGVSLAATGAFNSLLNANDVVTVSVSFSDAVTVTGAPQVALVIGGTTVQASFAGGSGTNVLTFTYAIQSGQTDIDGLSVLANGLALNGGTIQVSATNANLGHGEVSNNASFKVDTTAPTTGSLSFVDTGASTGGSASDGITNNGIVTVNGLESNATWEYTTNSGASWTTGTGNTFTLTSASTPTGTTYAANALQVRQTDAAGNVQTSNMATNAQNIRVDTVADTVVDFNGIGAGRDATLTASCVNGVMTSPALAASNVVVTGGDAVTSFTLRMVAALNFEHEKFVIGGRTYQGTDSDLGALANLTVTLLGSSVTFNVTSENNRIYRFTPTSVISNAQLEKLLEGIEYQNTSPAPGVGERNLLVKLFDTAGNEALTTLKFSVTTATTPLMLDLNGDGVHTSGVANGVLFDVNATGRLSKTGWSDGKDGLLVLDLNQDGQIYNGSELFGSGTELFTGGKAQDGYQALRQYDLNADGVINAQDAVFKDLKLWVDANIDGATDAGELRSLAELGVSSLNLDAITGTQVDQGNTLGLVSNWTDAKGQVHDMADVWFSTRSLEDLVHQATGVHKLDLAQDAAANTVHLTLADVLQTEQQLVVVRADANDVVRIDQSGWQDTGTAVTVDHHSYELWSYATAHLLIDQQAKVQAVL